MAYLKVKGEKNLVRDTETNAILNIDDKGLKAYYEKRNKIKAEKERQQRQEEEINNLQKDVKELKEMFHVLIETLNATNNK